MGDQFSREYLTPEEVAERYEGKISVRTLANWRSAGTGPPFAKIGGRILYKSRLLLDWEEQRTVNGTSQYKR